MREEHTTDSSKEAPRPADALGDLSRRSHSSRVYIVLALVLALIVVAFLVGSIVRNISGGSNVPEVPAVNLK